jgi:glycosyltransferase involved in cell wall biosynthesis
MAPILSICIFTYNRADLLESALGSLVAQVKALGDEVELIVSDNCSLDNTREIVEQMSQRCPIRYHRNDENIGAVRNARQSVEKLARGEFCWLLGDDELVRKGAVGAIVRALKTHPELDYFYVNYSIDSFHRREGISVEADDFQEWTRTGNQNLEERTVNRWEQLIEEDFNGLTAIYCSVYRRLDWLRAAPSLAEGDLCSSVDQTYPHAAIFSQTMVGKPAWVSGYPWVIMCGKESWSEFIPTVILLRFHELLDRYIDAGVHPRFVEGHRRRMLGYASEPLRRLFTGEKLAGLETFSVLTFAGNHWRYREMWWALRDAATTAPLRHVAKCSLTLAALAVPGKISHRVGTALARLRGGRRRVTRTAPE